MADSIQFDLSAGEIEEFDLSGEIEMEFDLDSLAGASPEPWVPDVSPAENSGSPAENSDSQDSAFSWMDEIEKFLLDEDADTGGDDFADPSNFFSGLFADGSELAEGEPAAPEAVTPSESAEGEPAAPDVVSPSESDKRDASVLVNAEDEDPISKKRRRQMRNRDSAMKSRERKKDYLKDLEMKSRYLESECRRLSHALQCYEAENMALRKNLQKEWPFGAPTAKQESAVLFVESLLLGSLFWLVSIVCLFLMPGLPIPDPKDASRLGRGLAREVVRTERLSTKRVGTELRLDLGKLRRRCRGTRTRMKLCLFPLHAEFCNLFV